MNFNNRVFGCAIIKSINANYNADFSHQPRTLPNGVVYATDKALKYSIKNYLKDNYPKETVFYFKRLNENFNPLDLDAAYEHHFPANKASKDKKIVAQDLLSCLDIRLFGATYANKKKEMAISIHGPVQINHGVNIWKENNIYSEQIMSPFSDEKKTEKKSEEKGVDEFEEKGATTLGRQSRLQEGHYIHHFSINPKNIADLTALVGDGAMSLQNKDIDKLKEALCSGVTYFDSAAKAGTDNEFLLWVQLKADSKTVLPNFTELIKLEKTAEINTFDLSAVKEITDELAADIEQIEIYYISQSVSVKNAPAKANKFDINTGKPIK
jgi:CRISPR-associated protein Csh2